MIQFDRQEFKEDDKTWDALFVKIDDAPWHMAQVHYDTEDENVIRNIIYGRKRCSHMVDNF